MIEIKSLAFSYGEQSFQLNIPDLRIGHAEKVAVIGPSGSGKTSLLKLLSGIYEPQQGEISIDGVAIHQLGDSRRRQFRIQNIGFIFQDFELLDYLNIRDNILHPYRISNALKLSSEVKARALGLATELGIADKMRRYPDTLSQGEKQRTAICRAMLTKPKLILADEATGNLDPNNKLRILDALFRSTEKNDATLIAVTHDHELLGRFDRVIDFKSYCKQEDNHG